MNPLDRITQLTEESRQLRRSVDDLRAQVETARQELAREAATIAKLAKDKRNPPMRKPTLSEVFSGIAAIALWIAVILLSVKAV